MRLIERGGRRERSSRQILAGAMRMTYARDLCALRSKRTFARSTPARQRWWGTAASQQLDLAEYELLAVLLRQLRFHAGDLARPAALQDRAALCPLADVLLQLLPREQLLLVTRPQHEASLWRHHGHRCHELGARFGLLSRNVIELVALAARHLRDLPDRESEQLPFARDDRDQ